MLPVETPFKTYTGLDGKPLNNGYVYFGQPNLNPLTAPVTVYWDAAGTQPALQPLRTVNGYIMRAGTPANVFFSGAYSELVQDSKKAQVFYARTSDEFSIATAISNFLSNLAGAAGSTLVGYLAAGVGAILRPMSNKLQDYADVTDFMSAAQIADARAYGYTLDSSAAFNKALVAGRGAIRIPPGGYVAKNLTIPAGVTIISVQGTSAVSNYYTRPNSTVVRTQGGDFIKGAAVSLLFCARDISIESTGQAGMCFGTTDAPETGFYFDNVGITGFEKGFWAPHYASSSFAINTSFTDCDYGVWAIQAANNSRLINMGYNRCANACRIAGFGVIHDQAQIGLGYTGAHAAAFPEYIGYDLWIGLVTVNQVYTEAYSGVDFSKNIVFDCCSTTAPDGDDKYVLNTFLSSGPLRHLRLWSQNSGTAIKNNLVEINGSVPNNCPNIETKPGQTGLIRGVKVNGRTFNSVAGGRAVFDTYDVEAVIAAGAAKVTTGVGGFGTTPLTLVGFDSPSINGFAGILNNANTTAASGRFFFPGPDYHHCPLGANGKTSAIFEIISDIAIDGLAAAKTFAVGVVYKIPGGGYTFKHVGDYKALARPGSALFDFSAAFKVNVRAATGSSMGICFLPSTSVDIPAAGDITGSLYGRIRVRFVED